MMKKKIFTTLSLLLPLGLAACATPQAFKHYNGLIDHGFTIPPIEDGKVPLKYQRQVVLFPNPYKKGTLIVDIDQRFLYFTVSESAAIRYGIGVPERQFLWYGTLRVHHKKVWPTWVPPHEMVARDPSVIPFRNGMAPGLENPLGARAIYLYENGRDTLYRFHGTPEWWSIGQESSSGCFRLLNEDIIDLYNRVSPGARVIVLKPAIAK